MKTQMVKRSIGVNAILNIIKQALSILFPMITVYTATRALGADNYGMVNYIKSNVSYFILLSGLGIPTYAIREGSKCREDRRKFNEFANEVFTINFISTLIATIILIVFLAFINMKLDSRECQIYFIFATSMFLSLFGADWINSIYEDFLYLTIRYIVIYGITLICLFTFVRKPADYKTYAILTVLATYGGNILNIAYIKKYTHLRLTRIWECKRHLKPILILFCSTIASTIYISSDTTILGALVGNQAVAIYTVASQIYVAIKHMTNAAVSVAIPRLSYFLGNNDDQKFHELVSKLFNYALFFLCPCVVGLFELSDYAMIFMGGKEYIAGALSLKVLSIALLFAVIAYVLSRCILIPSNKDGVFLTATVISALVNIVLNFIFIPRLMYTGAAITTLISEVIVFGIFLRSSQGIVKIILPWRDIIKSFCGCLSIILICKIIRSMNINLIPTILMSVALSSIAYTVTVLGTKHTIAIDVKNRINAGLKKIKL